LTHVEEIVDPLYGDRPLLEIEWAEADALPFPLCISAIGPAPECRYIENISVACGNVILVDHGWRVEDELLGRVPTDKTEVNCPDDCYPAEVVYWPGKYNPTLERTPLTFSQPLTAGDPASWLLKQDPRRALPWIKLISTPAEVIPFRKDQGLNLASLVAKLREARDALSTYLKDQFSRETRDLLEAYPGSGEPEVALQDALIGELNAQLENASLYDANRLSSFQLRRETLQLAERESKNRWLDRLLNRWLLEDAYPGEIPQSRRHFRQWTPRADLLGSQGNDDHFVVEVGDEGRAHLRFGDGDLGRRPEAETQFWATYRVGNGPAGNVGAETIVYLVTRSTALGGVTLQLGNPLPAHGGTPPEPLAEARLFAPDAFRADLQRAVVADDYARLVERRFETQVQRAAAVLRWMGNCYEVRVAVDARSRLEPAPSLLDEIAQYLERYRRIGHDVAVVPAAYVPLEITLEVCVLPGYLRGHVKAALLDRFGNRVLRDGRRGIFHPDNLTFGEGIYLSKLVALAQATPGVESVQVKQLERLGEGPNSEIENGLLPLGPLEIARLDNDPGFPENGRLRLDMLSGR
jgi:hypothetical protein